MEKRELKEKTKFQKWGFFRLFHSAFPACAGASAGRRNQHSAIGKGGFTLIEVIVLIVMAGILLPVIIVPFVTGVKSSVKPEMATKAMYLAHQKMEELMKFNYCRAPDLTPGTYNSPAPPVTGYTWQWVISYVTNTFAASGSDAGYKMIQVTVTDPQGSTYDVYSVVTRF